MKKGNSLKFIITMTVLLALTLTIFSGCGTTGMHYDLYHDAVAHLKEKDSLQMTLQQEITTVISGGPSTTVSTANIKAVGLDKEPVYQIDGIIAAIGANVKYDIYYEKGVCYMNLYGRKTKATCELKTALQKFVGLLVEDIDLQTLLELPEDSFAGAKLQTEKGINNLTVELKPEQFENSFSSADGQASAMIATYSIDQNGQFTKIAVETEVSTVYEKQEASIQLKLEFSFQNTETEIEITAPEQLETYTDREEKE